MAAESARVALRCEEAKHSRQLNLSGCGLRKFPDSVFFIVRDTPLQTLSLANNNLVRVPSKLGAKMTTITSEKGLEWFPYYFCLTQNYCFCLSLSGLDLSHNQLCSLPDELSSLTSLEYLDISYNQLSAVPDFIRQLPALTQLNAGHNLITTVTPDELTVCPSLQTADLSGNPLEKDVKSLMESVVRIKIVVSWTADQWLRKELITSGNWINHLYLTSVVNYLQAMQPKPIITVMQSYFT